MSLSILLGTYYLCCLTKPTYKCHSPTIDPVTQSELGCTKEHLVSGKLRYLLNDFVNKNLKSLIRMVNLKPSF